MLIRHFASDAVTETKSSFSYCRRHIQQTSKRSGFRVLSLPDQLTPDQSLIRPAADVVDNQIDRWKTCLPACFRATEKQFGHRL